MTYGWDNTCSGGIWWSKDRKYKNAIANDFFSLLPGLSHMKKRYSNPSLLLQANEIAQAAISTLTDAHGILHEACKPHYGADGTQFKGISVRNLRMLEETNPRNLSYQHFILTNADSIWS